MRRGPPYTDDPGCKYIVIEDPWPGNKSGKDRDQLFFNYVCAWVRFMLNKEYEPECVYYMNTRNEIIVQLSQDVDMVPFLGAHPWRRFLSRNTGDPRDPPRVSYVFAYDYRKKGEPGNHNWQQIFPDVTGDPPPHVQFPVLFPYPRPNWDAPGNKKCGDIALPLPTPRPDTSGFTQYQRPSQLTANTVRNAEAQREDNGPVTRTQEEQHPPPSAASGKLGKIDPYEEDTKALRSLHHVDEVKPRIKQEQSSSARVKTEQVKHEDEPYVPSETLSAAINDLLQQQQQALTSSSSSSAPAASSKGAALNGRVKVEDGLQRDLPGSISGDSQKAIPRDEISEVNAKREPTPPYQPSAALFAAIQDLQRPLNGSHGGSAHPVLEKVTVKPDPYAPDATKGLPSDAINSTVRAPGVKLEVGGNQENGLVPMNSQRVRAHSASLKRVKDEDRDTTPVKKFKTEEARY